MPVSQSPTAAKPAGGGGGRGGLGLAWAAARLEARVAARAESDVAVPEAAACRTARASTWLRCWATRVSACCLAATAISAWRVASAAASAARVVASACSRWARSNASTALDRPSPMRLAEAIALAVSSVGPLLRTVTNPEYSCSDAPPR